MFGCAGSLFSPVVASGSSSLVPVCGLLTAVTSLVAVRRSQGARAPGVAALRLSGGSSQAVERRLNSCGTEA